MTADDTGVWKALADPTRRAILDLLRDRARTTGELSAAFPEVTRFAVMKHLGVLEDAGLEVVVAAPRDKVFDALCRMGEWWPHAFREGAAVHLEPRVGGRFWEDWGDGDGALYATVTGIRRPDLLTCTGPMGMRTPVTAVWSMELSERDGGTLVRLSHHAVGPIDDETRAAYQEGWGEVLDALRAHLGLAT